MRTLHVAAAAALLLAAGTTGCRKKAEPAPQEEPQDLRTRAQGYFDVITAPEVDEARVAIGARLYHDTNLSADGTISCASCHAIPDGGDDGLRTSPGVGGAIGPINSPTTLNSHLNFVQFWDGRARTLEEQALGPIENPLEMAHNLDAVVAYLQSEPSYTEQFAEAFDGAITPDTIATALAEYERTLVTPNGPFDRWLQGEDGAMTDEQLAGLEAFMDVGCTTCHIGPGLGGTMFQRMGLVHDWFADQERELTDADMGRMNATGNEAHRHQFKVPLLRNVTMTAPYLHDGSIDDLAEVVRVMAHYQLGESLDDERIGSIVAFLGALEGDLPTVDLEALALPAPRTGAAPEGEGAAADDEAATP